MAATESAPGFLKPGSEWLLPGVTALLVVFHYAARADTIGVLGARRVWSPQTRPPLGPLSHFAAAALLLGVCPVLLARCCGLRPAQLGLGWGRPSRGLTWLGVGLPLAVLAGYIGAGSPAVSAVYPLDGALAPTAGAFVPHALWQFRYFGAWEVLFRGVLLFGLRNRLGAGPANLVQTALSVIAHFGRPLDETIAALPAGMLFGWVDLRIGSVWYIAVVHWVVGVSLDWFILTRGT
jgi:membrane protease YdiL (CAAX protease family)